MSLAQRHRDRRCRLLPSRRDEDWRWTDLRGLIRATPPPSPAWDGDLAAGPFAAVDAEQVAHRQRPRSGPDRSSALASAGRSLFASSPRSTPAHIRSG